MVILNTYGPKIIVKYFLTFALETWVLHDMHIYLRAARIFRTAPYLVRADNLLFVGAIAYIPGASVIVEQIATSHPLTLGVHS